MLHGKENWELAEQLEEIVELGKRYGKSILGDFNTSVVERAKLNEYRNKVLAYLQQAKLVIPDDYNFYAHIAKVYHDELEQKDIKLDCIYHALTESNDIYFIKSIQRTAFYQFFSGKEKQNVEKHLVDIAKNKIVSQTKFFKDTTTGLPDILRSHDTLLKKLDKNPFRLLGFEEKDQLTRKKIHSSYEEKAKQFAPKFLNKKVLLELPDALKILQVARDVLLYLKNHPQNKAQFECLKPKRVMLKY